mmetsp:Transcript_81068/g.153329  ORF Transcript_81068/g.153329 Transcript_81068/m.153329 type:complete len:203 (-) Transcript_81068:101-709(-)
MVMRSGSRAGWLTFRRTLRDQELGCPLAFHLACHHQGCPRLAFHLACRCCPSHHLGCRRLASCRHLHRHRRPSMAEGSVRGGEATVMAALVARGATRHQAQRLRKPSASPAVRLKAKLRVPAALHQDLQEGKRALRMETCPRAHNQETRPRSPPRKRQAMSRLKVRLHLRRMARQCCWVVGCRTTATCSICCLFSRESGGFG